MSRKHKLHDSNKLYFVSFAVVYWIDLFIREEYKKVVLNSWEYCIKHKGMELYGWCIMSSHIHMIIGSNEEKLEHIMRDMKRHTSVQLREAIAKHPAESRREWLQWMMERAGKKNGNNTNFQLWRQDNQPIELDSLKKQHDSLDYIHNNPVEAGIVEKAEDYLYSSARSYLDMESKIEIVKIEAMVCSLQC